MKRNQECRGPLDAAEAVLDLSTRASELLGDLAVLGESDVWDQIRDRGYLGIMFTRAATRLAAATGDLSSTGAFLSGYALSDVHHNRKEINRELSASTPRRRTRTKRAA